MLARRARGNTTVLYMAGFYGRTPYARADGRNLCAEIGGRETDIVQSEREELRNGRTFSRRVKKGHEREKKRKRDGRKSRPRFRLLTCANGTFLSYELRRKKS